MARFTLADRCRHYDQASAAHARYGEPDGSIRYRVIRGAVDDLAAELAAFGIVADRLRREGQTVH